MKKSSIIILMIAIAGGTAGAWQLFHPSSQTDSNKYSEVEAITPKKLEEKLRESDVDQFKKQSMSRSDGKLSSNANRSYASFPTNGNLEDLERYMSQGVIPTAENVDKALDMMRRASDPELVTLTRILARLHDTANSSTKNEEIVAKLRDLARYPNKEVARSAAVGLARMGGFVPGVEAALAAARDSGALTPDLYEGERVWVALSSPQPEQARILGEIAETKNKYATRVVAFVLLGHSDAVKVLEPESKIVLKEMVANTEPGFSKYANEAGLSDLFIYSDWLQLYGKLESPDNWIVAQKNIIKRLDSPGSDPRGIVAYLYGSHGRKAQEDPALEGEMARITEKANAYFDQFPSNQHIAYLRKAISDNARY